MTHASHATTPHLVPVSTFLKVWGVLVALTALLVFISSLHLGSLAIIATLIITPTKVGLVLAWFMHLKYERPGLRWMVASAFGALFVFLGLLLLDTVLR
jgi:cytochrome c oxidase subunit 4